MNFDCGPTVYCNISASAVFKNIICAEYTEANRRELGKWLSNDEDKFDWSVFFKYVAVLEGKKYNIDCMFYTHTVLIYSLNIPIAITRC